MNYADWRDRLQTGETIDRKVHGHSMAPRIDDGATVTIEPVTDPATVQKGDVVFCKVDGSFYVHLVKEVKFVKNGGVRKFQIANNRGHVNGWASHVYGKVTGVGTRQR